MQQREASLAELRAEIIRDRRWYRTALMLVSLVAAVVFALDHQDQLSRFIARKKATETSKEE